MIRREFLIFQIIIFPDSSLAPMFIYYHKITLGIVVILGKIFNKIEQKEEEEFSSRRQDNKESFIFFHSRQNERWSEC